MNASVTSEIVKSVANENYSIALVRSKLHIVYTEDIFLNTCYITGAARIYFLTQQRRSKRVSAGKLDESRAKQRRTQRKHNVSDHKYDMDVC